MILGLMAIPYLDFNPRGNGYYTIAERPVAWLVFQFGFLGLWVLLILIGTFFRGPNWGFFGLYEPHEPHALAALPNVTLAQYGWTTLLGRSVPQVVAGSGALAELGQVLRREAFGLSAVALYYLGLPALLRYTLLRRFGRRMGWLRYSILVLLLLTMLLLPLKMLLNWTLHLNYLVSIPEFGFNV